MGLYLVFKVAFHRRFKTKHEDINEFESSKSTHDSISVMLSTINLIYFSFIQAAQKMLNCNWELEVLQADPSVQCRGNSFRKYVLLGLTSLLIYGIGTIGLFGLVLRNHRIEIKKNLSLWKKNDIKNARGDQLYKKYGSETFFTFC